MLSWELAEQLKIAGWPQTKGLDDIFYGKTDLVNNKNVVFPDLGELVAACGDRFALLSHTLENKEWKCFGYNSADEMKISRTGPSPEDATAKLWLILREQRKV